MLFVFMEVEHGPQEAIVMMQTTELSDQDLNSQAHTIIVPPTPMVAMAQGFTPPQSMHQAPNSQLAHAETQEHEERAKEEHAIDEALDIAHKLLKSNQAENTQLVYEEKKEKPFIKQAISQSTQPSESHKSLTFSQLAQGFMQHVQIADMAVRSDHVGPASMDQIKHVNYCQKIIGCIVNSYQINNHTIKKKQLARRARILLALNKNGSIHTLSIAESSGDPETDQFLLKMFEYASSSFPPVPPSFSQSPYYLPAFSVDHLESFHSTRGWYIDNRTV